VQHTTDFLTKQPQTYKIRTRSNIVTTNKLNNNTTHCSRTKCQPQQTLVHIISGIEEKKLPVFFIFCNLKMQLQTKKEYIWSDTLPIVILCGDVGLTSFMLEWQAICAAICRLNFKYADLTLSCRLLALLPWYSQHQTDNVQMKMKPNF